MEIRHLNTFAKAAELESFTRAAEALGLTQAAVSQHVKALEKEFGVEFFERTGRTVHLGEAGKRLYDYARQILDLADEARRDIGQTETILRGTLRIATSTVPAELLLPQLLAEFRSLCPEVRESVVVSDSTSAAQSVESADADVGFVGELPRSSRLRARAVDSDELVLVVSPGHRLAKKKKLSLRDLPGEPLIVREPGSGSRRCVEQALEAAGISSANLSIVMEINSNEAIRAAVERGVGAAFLSRQSVDRDTADGRLVRITVGGFRARRQLYVVTNAGRMPTATLREFLAFLDRFETKPS